MKVLDKETPFTVFVLTNLINLRYIKLVILSEKSNLFSKKSFLGKTMINIIFHFSQCGMFVIKIFQQENFKFVEHITRVQLQEKVKPTYQ